MTTDERLIVMLEARVTEFEKRMQQAERRGTRTYQSLRRGSQTATRQMEQDMARSASRMNQALNSVGSGVRSGFGFGRMLIGGVAVAAGVKAAKAYARAADVATKMQNALRVVGIEGEELTRVYGKLFQSAQRNSAPVSSLVDLYSKLALTQNELGVTSDELIQFTDGIAVALKVAGTDAATASGSLLQLSQALGGGIVRAEEFNSILEGTPTIAQAVARGLKEASGSVAELRKLVVDGKVSSTAFFRAFEAGSDQLREQAESSQTTVGQAFTRLGNSIVTVVGEFDKATGASEKFADAAVGVSKRLDGFADGQEDRIAVIVQAFRDAETGLNNLGNSQLFADLNEVLGITENGQIINPDVAEAERKIAALERDIAALQAQVENNTELGFDNREALVRLREVRDELAALRAEAANLPAYTTGASNGTIQLPELPPMLPAPQLQTSKVVSIADHPTKPDKDKKKKAGKAPKEKLDDYAKETQAIRERTAALELEAASLALVAASGEDYGDALEYARKRAELMHAVQKAGKEITPALQAEIDKLAQAYVAAGISAEEAAEKMERIKEQSERGKDAIADMFGSVVDGSKSAKDAVIDLLNEIVKIQMLNAIMAIPGMGRISSSLGGMLTPSFDVGGYTWFWRQVRACGYRPQRRIRHGRRDGASGRWTGCLRRQIKNG